MADRLGQPTGHDVQRGTCFSLFASSFLGRTRIELRVINI